MSRNLTKKRRGFVNTYADTGNATVAVKEHFEINTTDGNSPAVIGSKLLKDAKVQEELKKLGFDSNNAKRVVGQILNDEDENAMNRLNAADKVFKVNSDYAPEKHVNLNVDAELHERERELGLKLLGVQKN